MAKELELLHSDSAIDNAETVVILHDACYGHRFARLKTSQRVLNSIVERPERIQASVLGLALAYVRLGERHSDGKHPIHPDLDPKSLPNVPFRIHKTTRTLPLDSTTVTNVHGSWAQEMKALCNAAAVNLANGSNELTRPDAAETLNPGDLYLCPESLNACEGSLGAVCEAVDKVFGYSSYKRAFVAVRPPGHHCSAADPSGFCWVNNVHVGIMHGFLNHGVTHAAIIDFDLHHGDGSQSITQAHIARGRAHKSPLPWKKTSIGYFSLHDIESFPCEEAEPGDVNLEKVMNASLCIENAHGYSIWNTHLEPYDSDVEFWRLYRSKYSIILDKTRRYLRKQAEECRKDNREPKAAIFLSAGFDASEFETEGMQRHGVKVPTEFYARITRDVIKIASEEGLGVEGRIISVLEGGYSDRALYSGVLSHLSGLAGDNTVTPKEGVSGGLAYELASRIGPLSRRNTLTEHEMTFPYDPSWWSASELDQLDAAMIAQPSQEPPKRPRGFTPGNYSVPTRASSAKAVDPTKVRRVASFTYSQAPMSRMPTPPPPDIPWTAAAHELSKLLIPTDRPVVSYTRTELFDEASRIQRERKRQQNDSMQNGAVDASNDSSPPIRKSTRAKRPVQSLYVPENDDSYGRRKTVGGPTVLATEKVYAPNDYPTRIKQASNNDLQALARGIPSQNGSTASTIPRPASSQSMRPESAMSVQSQAPGSLDIKKTRIAPAKKQSSRAPRKPKVPAIKTQSTSQPMKKEPTIGSSGVSSIPATDTVCSMEEITNGMNKVKIDTLTRDKMEHDHTESKAQEEKEARHTPSNDTANTLPTEMGVVQASPPKKPVKIKLIKKNGVSLAGSGSGSGSGSPIERERGLLSTPPPNEVPVADTISSVPAVMTPAPAPAPVTAAAAESNNGLPLPQNGAYSMYGVTSPPSSSPARGHGHGFTSTSTIPFAP